MTAMKEQPSARQIYGTIGPACADVETLEAMFRAGMTGIRRMHCIRRRSAAESRRSYSLICRDRSCG